MNRLALWAVFWVTVAAAARAQAWDEARLQKFFEWGRYDSLILEMAPMTWGPQAPLPVDQGDSLRFAKARLYLGVAFFAEGRTPESDQAFRQALEWDPDAKLDPFFVSDAIAARFQALAAEPRMARREETAATGNPSPEPLSLAKPSALRSDTASERPRPGARPMGGNRSRGLSSSWYWGGAGVLAALAVGGGIYFLNQPDPDPVRIHTPIDARSHP